MALSNTGVQIEISQELWISRIFCTELHGPQMMNGCGDALMVPLALQHEVDIFGF